MTGFVSTFQNNIWWFLIRSKHNDLLNYFIHDKRDLSPAYVKKCEKFFKDIEQREGIKFAGKFKPQAPSATKKTQLKSIIKTERNKNAKI